MSTFLATAVLAVFAEVPWIGDGRSERSGADWYAADPAPEFVATFAIPESAGETLKLYLVTPGYAMVNGLTVFPLWSPYDHTIYAETVELPRTNRVSVILGNGWYNMPPLRFWGAINFREHLAHGRLCFKLAIEGVEGPLDWKWRETDIVQNSIQLGATVDRTRAEDAEWKPAVVVKGPKGRIVPRLAPPVALRRGEWLDGEVTISADGETAVIDFGENATGCPAFCFRGTKRGQRIEIVYGERLNTNGTVNVLTQTAGQIKRGNGGPGAPAVAAQRDELVCRGGRIEWFEPPFSWHVCRYAEVRGVKGTRVFAALKPLSSQLVAVAPGADFKSANADFNRIHEMSRRTFRANLVGVQSDCPGRERLGYGGDIVASAEAMMLNYDMKEFYLKTLQDFADEAADDGWLTETAPYVGIANDGFGGRSGPISWTVAVPVLMDGLIRHYPDAKDRALAFYPVCTRYIALVDAACPDGIVPRCIGDHEALERAPNEVTATAHWYEFLRLTAKFAALLGKADDEMSYRALADKVREAFVRRFVTGGIVANGTQSAQAIALYLGLVPVEQVAAAEARLEKAIEEKGFAPSTGIFSTRYMLMYLSEHGKRDLAERIVLHRGFPGWLHMLERGATTLWETWKESDNAFSNCHPMFGSVDEWILRFGR